MLSEFQISADRLVKTVQTTFRDTLGATVFDPMTIAGEEIWVVRVKLVGEASIESGPGDSNFIDLLPDLGVDIAGQDVLAQLIVVTQNLQLDLATRSAAVFTPLESRTIRVPFILRSSLVPTYVPSPGQKADAGMHLVIEPGKPTLVGDDDPTLQSILETRMGDLIKPVEFPIPFDVFMLPNTGSSADFSGGVNSGIALSDDKTFLSLRLEMPTFARTADPWRMFYLGRSENRLSTAGPHGFLPSSSPAAWCLFVARQALIEDVRNAVYSALREAAVFDVLPGVTSDWSGLNGGIRISASFTGQKTLTTVLGEDIIGELSASLTLDVSVPETNVIRLDVSFAVSGSIEGIDVSYLIQLIANSMLSSYLNTTFAASNVLGDKSSALGPLGQNMQCTVTSDSTMRCEGSVIPPSAGGLVRNLRDALGLSNGVVFMGDGSMAPLLPDPEAQLDMSAFDWSVLPPSCNELYAISQEARQRPMFELLVAAGLVMEINTVEGSWPLWINRVDILDDFANLYRDVVVGDDIHTFCGYPPPSYPCVLAIHTNIGVILAQLFPPPTLTTDQANEVVGKALQASVGNCERLKDPWHLKGLKPDWLVDPASKVANVTYAQLWEFEVPASSVDGIVTAHLGPNRAEVRSYSHAGRQLSASFVTRQGQGLELQFRELAAAVRSVEQNAGVATGALADSSVGTPRLGMTQTLLQRATQLPLGSSLRAIELLHTGYSPLLAAGSANGLSLFDLRTSSNPTLVITISLEGLAGLAVGPRGQVLGWGDFGLVAIERYDAKFRTTQLLTSPVRSLVRLGGQWFASRSEGIAVLDSNLQQERLLPQPREGCGHLCSISDKLLWTSDGAALQWSLFGVTWNLVGSDVATLPSSFETVRVGHTKYLFAAHDKAGGSMWMMLASRRLAMVADYDEDPWFRRSGRLSKLFATADRAGMVSIYDVVGQRSQ